MAKIQVSNMVTGRMFYASNNVFKKISSLFPKTVSIELVTLAGRLVNATLDFHANHTDGNIEKIIKIAGKMDHSEVIQNMPEFTELKRLLEKL